MNTSEIVNKAWREGIVIPGFNIPYLPMMAPVIQALRDTNSFGLVMVARLEWMKFESESLEAVSAEYQKLKDEKHTRLHLDHIPVIDEDNIRVDFEEDISRALDNGYESVMVDGSRLPLNENIEYTKRIVELAGKYNVPVEAELGAVMGHESGPMPSYDELFESKKGFTSPDDAKKFVDESGADWLSVAIGNIHGAISAAKKQEKKLEAKIDIAHLAKINELAGVPLVLHGGTGIRKEYILEGIKHGIAKINVATAIRQPYENALEQGIEAAQQTVYEAMLDLIKNELLIENSRDILFN
jgi:fructose-bisphosphate aldolase class II